MTGGLGTETGVPVKWSGSKPAEVHKMSGQCSHPCALDFGGFCVETGAGLEGSWGSLPAGDILAFYHQPQEKSSAGCVSFNC